MDIPRCIAAACLVAWCSLGGIAAERSPGVKAEFRRLQACPITGEHKGPCPGFEIDHIQALVCGGRDEVDNLQWLPVDDHREKTRRDMKGCRTRPK
jgi:hypothetical protein